MADVQKVVAGLHIPSNIRVEYGGTFQEQQRSFHDLVVVLILAVLLLFIVLLFVAFLYVWRRGALQWR